MQVPRRRSCPRAPGKQVVSIQVPRRRSYPRAPGKQVTTLINTTSRRKKSLFWFVWLLIYLSYEIRKSVKILAEVLASNSECTRMACGIWWWRTTEQQNKDKKILLCYISCIVLMKTRHLPDVVAQNQVAMNTEVWFIFLAVGWQEQNCFDNP